MNDMPRVQSVLVVDDEPPMAKFLLEILARRGVHATAVFDGEEAMEHLESNTWDLVLTDMKMPKADGLSVLRKARQCAPEMPVVMITGYGSVDSAVEAMRAGCYEFLTKPLTADRVENVLDSLLPTQDVPRAVSDEDATNRSWQIVGESQALRRACELAVRIARSTTSVLIEGESGVGKELIAELIHDASMRAGGPFVRVNCAAVSESLMESELFGHERGAFTGAHARRIGRFEQANRGTLMMDEITETSPRLQAELLRYRLNGVSVRVPALRERVEDVPALVWHFVNLHKRESRRRIDHVDPAMLDALADYCWPGNVRQLRSVVRAALILGAGPVLSLGPAAALMDETLDDGAPVLVRVPQTVRECERELILETMRHTANSRIEAARLLGITARTLRTKLARYRQEGRWE